VKLYLHSPNTLTQYGAQLKRAQGKFTFTFTFLELGLVGLLYGYKNIDCISPILFFGIIRKLKEIRGGSQYLSPNTVNLIKSRRMRWAGPVGEMRNACKI
jgi:hypothetical protein